MMFYSIFFDLLLFIPRRLKSWKGKMTAYPILKFIQSFVKFQNIDPEVQMKDDVLYHIFIFAIFLTSEVKSWKGYSFTKFQRMVQEMDKTS